MMPPADRLIPPDVLEVLRAKIAAEDARRATYGEVRPIISTVMQDRRIVAVGSSIYWNTVEKWRTFTDFLCYFIQHVFEVDWGAAELQKPLADRHVIMKWCDALRQLQLRNPKPDEHGVCSGEPD